MEWEMGVNSYIEYIQVHTLTHKEHTHRHTLAYVIIPPAHPDHNHQRGWMITSMISYGIQLVIRGLTSMTSSYGMNE